MKYRRLPTVLEAYTFEEFVEYGRQHAPHLQNGVPWSFTFRGYNVTHETNDRYSIASPDGGIDFRRTDLRLPSPDQEPVLVVDPDGKLSIYGKASFLAKVEAVVDVIENAPELFNFSHALTQAIAMGRRICRAGWNGKGQWVAHSGTVLRGKRVEAAGLWSPHSRAEAERQGGSVEVLPALILKNAQGQIVMGWAPSQGDLFAEDWMIYADPAPSKFAPHQDRVIAEHAELAERLEKLDAFIGGVVFTKVLDEAEQQRLRAQAEHMREYARILAIRITAFVPLSDRADLDATPPTRNSHA